MKFAVGLTDSNLKDGRSIVFDYDPGYFEPIDLGDKAAKVVDWRRPAFGDQSFPAQNFCAQRGRRLDRSRFDWFRFCSLNLPHRDVVAEISSTPCKGGAAVIDEQVEFRRFY